MGRNSLWGKAKYSVLDMLCLKCLLAIKVAMLGMQLGMYLELSWGGLARDINLRVFSI